LYVSWLWLFGIKSLALQKTLLIIFGILSVSFVISNLLVRYFENFITEKLYFLSSVWLGIAWYITLATVLSLIIIWIFFWLGIKVNTTLIISILIGLAVFFSGYGIWNARQIKARNITVSLKNLPASWRGMTAVHVSDVHIGTINRYSFVDKVVKKVNKASPDIVFITGDLVDGAGQKLNHLLDAFDNIKTKYGKYFVTGNHETYISLDKSLAAIEQTNITVLRDQLAEVEGVQILGIDYPGMGKKIEFEKLFGQLNVNKPCIVLYHEPTVQMVTKAQQAGADLMLSGHTHVGQLWPFNWVTKKMYQGRDYGYHQEGEFTLYTSPGVGTWGPPMKTISRSEITVINFE